MVNPGGNPEYEFNDPAMYPPSPMKRAPPKETKPVKWAKKSNERESRA
jgi:hypothetical protein